MTDKHLPNPFDFVPFAQTGKPYLKLPSTFDGLGDERLSGYLTLKVKTLTPLHVVGYQDRSRARSYMYQQGGQVCLPAATIRGCLRAFVEALTAGWVSQANLEYGDTKEKKRGRHFMTFMEKTYAAGKGSREYKSPAAVEAEFQPTIKPHEGNSSAEVDETPRPIDLASYLFGIVFEVPKGETYDHADVARKGKVLVEDAFFDTGQFTQDNWVPELVGSAFFGGGKPNASNWWYMSPRAIAKAGNGNAEFVGDSFRGRKFYYHQKPQKCLAEYEEWIEASKSKEFDRQLTKLSLECVRAGSTSQEFRIYVDRLPRPLIALLIKILMPGATIRHKLGYGKPFGYGSVEFSVLAARLRVDDGDQRLPGELKTLKEDLGAWKHLAWEPPSGLVKIGLPVGLIDSDALKWLTRILGWVEADLDTLAFVYPRFEPKEFAQVVKFANAEKEAEVASAEAMKDGEIEVDTETGTKIAKALFEIKRPIDYRVYQEEAAGWDLIEARYP